MSLWHKDRSFDKAAEQLSPVFRQVFAQIQKRLTFWSISLIQTFFPRNDSLARWDQFWKPWRKSVAEKHEKNRWNQKNTKQSYSNFTKKISSKCSWDRQVQIWQKCRSFSPTSQKIFHSMPKSGGTFLCFVKETILIKSFLLILKMQFWPNWQKWFVWKFTKYSVKFWEREKRNLSKKTTFFLQKVTVDT